jgi:hypothetical protein
MDYNEIIQKGLGYFQTNPAAAISISIIILFLLFKKPKLLFILIFLVLAGIGVMHLIAKLSSTGLEHKKIPFLE